MKNNTKYLLILLVSMVLIAGSSSGGDLSIKDAWARPGMAGGNSAVYFLLDNPTGEDDVLLEGAATQVEIFHHGFERLGVEAADNLQGYEEGWDIKHLKALRGLIEA